MGVTAGRPPDLGGADQTPVLSAIRPGWRLRRARPPLWALSVAAGAASVGFGWLPPGAAGQTLGRVAPVLIFLVAVTVLAELSDAAGVFAAAAAGAARLARGRTWLLFVLVLVIATLSTILLSLDTTAVLLTPVVLTMCARLELSPLPFALATVWLANTASLLLPVSNLTNLLAVRQLGLSPARFAGLMWAPALAAIVVTSGALLLWHRRRLGGRYRRPAPEPIEDRLLFGACTGAIALFAALLALGVEVTACSLAAAGLATLACAVRAPARLGSADLLPWRLVLLVSGLFVLVEGAHRHGLDAALSTAAGTGTGLGDLLRLAGVAALGANAVNNLPAYLALEPVAQDSSRRLLAVLIGVDVGPVVTVWASLATLLWIERCKACNVTISARSFALAGLVLAPAGLLAAVAALWLSR